MKQIGWYVGNDRWSSMKAVGDELYITDEKDVHPLPPIWNRIGYILLGDRDGGTIYGNRERSGRNGVPCYVAVPAVAPELPSPVIMLSDRLAKLEQALIAMTAAQAEAMAAMSKALETQQQRLRDLDSYVKRQRPETDAIETQRLWFAAAALQAIIPLESDKTDYDTIAAMSFDHADAMINYRRDVIAATAATDEPR